MFKFKKEEQEERRKKKEEKNEKNIRNKTPLKGWQRCPPDLGARISRYRCFLPDLAGFPTYRREGTNNVTIIKDVKKTSKERLL